MERYIKKILAPVDGSEHSKKALEMAIVLAKASGAKLTVLEVIEEFGPLPGYYGASPPNTERVKWISEQRFENVHPMLEEEKVKWDRVVVEGYAADKICEIAEKDKFDLIVIGSHGHTPIGRFLMGSVSDRIVHHASCSVTVVK